jgi:tripartite-type tricarboxylate transporter receptor subunit TctC
MAAIRTRVRKTDLRMRLMAMLALAVAATISDGARSQTPKTIKVVVPNPPGGVSDLLARLVADEIGRRQGQAFLIETRPGAAGDIGSEAVSRAAPDGETLLINANPLVINANLRRLGFDPLADLVPICQLVRAPTALAVNAASPYGTLNALLDSARLRPGSLTLASIGPGSATHVAFEALKRAAKVEMTFVPYAGTAPAVNALLGEHVTSYFGNYADVREQAAAGKLRVLATGSATRTELLPDVPTIAESGFPSVHIEVWFGIFAPGKTPDETQTRLAAMFSTAVHSADLKSKLLLQGLYATGICGAQFRDFVRSQYDDYGRMIRETNFPRE